MKGVTSTEFKKFFWAENFDLIILKRHEKYHFKLIHLVTKEEFFLANARMKQTSLRFKTLDTARKTSESLGFKKFLFEDQDSK